MRSNRRNWGDQNPAEASHRLAAALRARRRALGLSQLEACALAGVGPAFLYQREQGKPTVRMDKLLAVLAVLGLGLELRELREPLAVAPDLAAERDR